MVSARASIRFLKNSVTASTGADGSILGLSGAQLWPRRWLDETRDVLVAALEAALAVILLRTETSEDYSDDVMRIVEWYHDWTAAVNDGDARRAGLLGLSMPTARHLLATDDRAQKLKPGDEVRLRFRELSIAHPESKRAAIVRMLGEERTARGLGSSRAEIERELSLDRAYPEPSEM
jgi:hypothetical protein